MCRPCVIVSNSAQAFALWQPILASRGQIAHLHDPAAISAAQIAAMQFAVFDLGLFSPAQSVAEIANYAQSAVVWLLDQQFTIEEEIRWLAMGVKACCTPDLEPQRLAAIVDVTTRGGIWVSSQAMPFVLNGLKQMSATQPAKTDALAVLTPQERKIACLVAQGESNKLIARHLNISDHTVKAHLGAIFGKLRLSDRMHLALFVNQEGNR
ncbi:response regulator transcription factor [Chitinibacter bivalviorum]|nr:response regulator transcription factor [Chitinibacter bivalviorum]